MDQLPRPPDLLDFFDGRGDARVDAQHSEDLGFLDLLADLDLRHKPRDEGAEHDFQGPDDGLLDERGAEKDACADEDVDRQVAENVRLLSAAKQLIGSGSVKVFAEKLLGYYVLVKFECSDEKCIKFLADYWRLAGPRAFQCQLAMFAQDVCKIGSHLQNTPQDVTDAQDMYMAALAAAKKEEPLRDTPEAIRSYFELAKYYGKDSFLEMLLGFLIGDGGAYVLSRGYRIGLYQSHRAFLVAWSQALADYGFGALKVTERPIEKKTLGNRVVASTRTPYKGGVVGEAACRGLAEALVAAAARRGLLFDEKVRTLQMMRDRPFSQEVLRDWNAEESEASEAEEDG